MPTIKEIAKRANVSISTVSNVINNTSKVKDSTRAKVLQAMEDLGYEGQSGDKEGRARQLGTLGIIIEDITVFYSPEIYAGICEAAQEAGYSVLACNLGLSHAVKASVNGELITYEAAQRAVNLLLSKDVDAIIYVGSQCREVHHLSSGYSSGTPFVYAYCYSNDPNTASVVYDDEEITYQLISYLIREGHREIGVIAGPQSGEHVRLRLTGYQKALFDASILYNPNMIYYGNWEDGAFGYHCAEHLIHDGATAIFCMNDLLAGGVIDYMHDQKIDIPEKVSVVGFDNIAASISYYPKLTTVALPLMEIGREAVVQAFKLLHTRNIQQEAQIIHIPCTIVYRNSVAPRAEKTTR